MSRHDRATFEGFPDIDYQEIDLDDIISDRGNLTKVRIYQLLERHCLTPTYEIDLPVYLVMDRKGAYKGHIQGAKTVQELRSWYSESICSPSTP